MRKIVVLALLTLLLSVSLASAQELCDEDCNKTCIYFFYGSGCTHCARVEPYLHEMEQKYDFIDVKEFEIYFNETNRELFNSFCDVYCVDLKGVPIVFISDKFLVGDEPILENLENEIKNCQFEDCPCPHEIVDKNITVINGSKNTTDPHMKLTIPALVTAAAADSINPCAFSVLIFLLVYLLSLGAKSKIIKVGMTYIIVVFLVYFLSGLGLFTIIQVAGITRSVYKIAAVIAIAAGLINVKDFFWYGKGFSLKIPESRRETIEKYVKKATIPGAIILGILVSMFELPCTGGVYLAILGMLANSMTRVAAIPYLLLYNFIFVLPLFVILGVVYKGIPPEKVESWRTEKRKWMKLVMGLVMILLGVIMLLGWI